MDKLTVMGDLTNSSAGVALFQSVALVTPNPFPIILFFIWIVGIAAIYFTQLKTTGKKRFWQSAVAMSFACFILSLSLAALNSVTITILEGYWVAFYILMTIGSWYLLTQYK